MKVIVVGPRGKMGKLITQVAAARDDMELVAGIGPKDREYIGKDLGTVAMVGRELGDVYKRQPRFPRSLH